ncbi:MAG: hypothetical protein JW976_15585 [Syntrophaceae bacterium]|nr:hypothetical protein [Syntrophaceae bacterium]
MQKYSRHIWKLFLALYIVYAGAFIYRTSFVVDGSRYFSLFDDAMVSMRYAKNLSQGHGLVWNPRGEKIEGFSNPLWVLFMTIFHFFPISTPKISLFIQISGAIFMVLNLCLVKKISDIVSGGSIRVALSAVILTAFYLPLNFWILQGTEVSLLTVLTSLVVWEAIRLIKSGGFSCRLFILLGIGTWIRMDMIVPYLAILAFLILSSSRHRFKNLGWGLFILLAFSGLQTLARFSYYHEFLPNTYYLKMTGYPLLLRVAHGMFVFMKFIHRSNWLLFLFPLSIFFFRRDKTICFLYTILLGQVTYSIWVGGDAWESFGGSNRYISIAMPLLFILFSISLDQFRVKLLGPNRDKHYKPDKLISWGSAVFFTCSLINFNVLNDSSKLKNWLLIDRPHFVDKNEIRVREALMIAKLTDNQAMIAVTWAGALPYFAERNAIDMLGKNDLKIARKNVNYLTWPGTSALAGFIPGHLKWDYEHSIGALKPDVVVQTWLDIEKAEHLLCSNYHKKIIGNSRMYFRNGSPHISWEKLMEVEKKE